MDKKRKPGSLLPIILGAAAGVLAARLLSAGRPAIYNSRNTKSGALSELKKLTIGGTEQWLLIRSDDIEENPVLLQLHGGPGVSEMTMSRKATHELEAHFTVVNWDQRGAGKSYKAGADESHMTIDQILADTHEVVHYLLQRFGKKKIYLRGRSWGSAIGMLMVARFPELFYAFVGIGQISSMIEGEKASYRWTLDQAIARGDRGAIQELERMGPPPYSGDWLKKFNTQRKYVARYGGEAHKNRFGGNRKIVGSLLISEEYTLTERLMYYNAVQRSLRLLHPQLMEVDLFRDVPRVEVPVFIATGVHDQVVPAQWAAKYFETLQAPSKELIWFRTSAHMPDLEEKALYEQMMVEKVLPLSQRS